MQCQYEMLWRKFLYVIFIFISLYTLFNFQLFAMQFYTFFTISGATTCFDKPRLCLTFTLFLNNLKHFAHVNVYHN